MRCPTLSDLPAASPEKTEWPWGRESPQLPDTLPDGRPWPKVSIVMPSYNHGGYVEETIRSVLLQGYPNLEFIIIDGGSADETINVIKKYEQYITYWVSEPDRGQSHAINKGLEKCSGDYLAWMNTSDCYLPEALSHTFSVLTHQDFDLSYGPVYAGQSLNENRTFFSTGIKSFELKYLLRFFYIAYYIIPSQSVFLSRQLFEKAGLLREDLEYWMDVEWYLRFALEQPKVYRSDKPICFYRFHDDAKTSQRGKAMEEAEKIVQEYVAYLPVPEKRKLLRLMKYTHRYEDYYAGIKQRSFMNLAQTIVETPVEALSDRRFLGIVKQHLLGKSRFKVNGKDNR